ncbi:minor curlin subunit [Pontibacter ummariensis]|uniref:Minor curlin subunit n=1 Tax=Pontibacter ummariensis TaxID=1610492 RepID=A0A239KJV9_9BACT|nr:hypothetical protein [Pontibacter ummariensis]PRY05720.1 minor curlin subunit [Pontibacter ummariensis]SNT17998.1 minor curlin subunit [Pontibacter ummariensis]
MKRAFALLFACILLQTGAYSQSIGSEAQLMKSVNAARISELAQGQATKQDVRVIQDGDRNHAAVFQRNSAAVPNAAFITQVGDFNTIVLQQSGQRNQVNATQLGVSNSYRGEIDGVSNTSTVYQQGTANEINQQVQGMDLEYTLIQQGNNNSINQIETSPQSRPYTVIQQGNNMNITIEQSSWAVPVKIK